MIQIDYGEVHGEAAAKADRMALRLLVLCLAAYAVHAVYAAATHRHLYGDAAWFLVRIISEGDVTSFYSDFAKEFYYSRFVAYGLTQLPTVLAARLGAGDWQLLSWVLGATYFLHKPLSLIVCYRLLPTGTKAAIVFPVLAVFAGTINSEIYIVTETHIAVSLFWPLLIAFSQVRDPGARYFICCTVALFALAFSYESMAFLGPLLWMVVLVRWLVSEPRYRGGWAWLLLVTVFPVVTSWMAILLPRDPTNKAAFTDGLLLLYRHSVESITTLHAGPAISLLALLAVVLVLLMRRPMSKWAAGILLAPAAAALLLLPLLHFLLYSEHVDFTYAITDRGFGGLMVQALLAPLYLLGWLIGFERLRRNAASVAVLVAALAIGQVSWQMLATDSWSRALQGATVTLAQHRGLVPCSEAVLPPPDSEHAPAAPMLCHWWAMPLSILLAPDEQVRALLTSSESFRPFDPLDASSLPTMQYAPVDFNPMLVAARTNMVLRSGETVSFTGGQRGVQLLKRGFSNPESWATWTDGEEAELTLCLEGTGPHQATFTLTPFVNPQRPLLEAEVLVNDVLATHWRFDEGETVAKRSLALQGGKAGAGDGCARIVLRLSDARPASELGAPADPRKLGLAFVSLEILTAGQ